MRHSKIADRVLTIVELLLLAAIVLFSFYLIYRYMTQGETASGTTVVDSEETASVTAVVDADKTASVTTAADTDETGSVTTVTDPDETAGCTAAADTDETASGTTATDPDETTGGVAAADSAETEEEDTSFSLLSQTSADESTMVRVQILDNEYSDSLFDKITVSGENGLIVERGMYADDYTFLSGSNTADEDLNNPQLDCADEAAAGEPDAGETASVKTAADVEDYEEGQFVFSADDLCEGEAFHLIPEGDGTLTVTSLERADGPPTYEGELYIYRMEGGLALVNVLSLREYLYSVVSSEMSSGFPAEALKAQAICARTYVLQRLENCKTEKLIADLDDSVRFQVYNNYRATDSSRDAVDQTDGKILLVDDVQYYSTSCLSEKRDDLGEEEAFREFLSEAVEDGAEYRSAWVRWQCEISAAGILEKLDREYDICAEYLDEVEVVSRAGNGQALLLRVTAGGESVEIAGEYAIRKFLSSEEMEVERSDKTTVTGMQLLPSAFFYIKLPETEEAEAEEAEKTVEAEAEKAVEAEKAEIVLCIYGGGYGHGNGMSQSGAAWMASQGASCEKILEYYFGD
ncbi:MAG: SpoIID/LytB domain-containing protein [Lachnospiraceae bacterium]|nr:SpoIID/LytB domain-containing protein [Lachnospiraceae bacterium]